MLQRSAEKQSVCIVDGRYARVLDTGCGEVNVCDSARKRSKAYG